MGTKAAQSTKGKSKVFVQPGRMLRNVLLTIAAGLLLIAIEPDGNFALIGMALVQVPFAFGLAIAVHEFGHLLAAKLGGLKPVLMVLGNLWVRFVGPRPRIGFSKAFLTGGYVMAAPKKELSRSSAVLLFAGGFTANIVTVLGAIALCVVVVGSRAVDSRVLVQGLVGFTTLFIWFTLFLLPHALIPRVKHGFMTDGGYIRESLRNPNFVKLVGGVMTLSTQQFDGLRPRHWDRSLCQRLLEEKDSYSDPLSIMLLAYYIEMDQGNIGTAEELLEGAKALVESTKTLTVEVFHVEAAFFYGFHRLNDCLCLEHIEACNLLDVSPVTSKMLDAALAFAEGEFDQAARYGSLYLSELDPPMSPGLDAYHRDAIAQLIEECRTRLGDGDSVSIAAPS